VIERIERKAPPGEKVGNRSPNQRTTVPRVCRHQFVRCQPQGSQDAVVQGTLRMVLAQLKSLQFK